MMVNLRMETLRGSILGVLGRSLGGVAIGNGKWVEKTEMGDFNWLGVKMNVHWGVGVFYLGGY